MQKSEGLDLLVSCMCGTKLVSELLILDQICLG